ncbi:MAG: GNAT family N-acetyltransferase [Thalassovita sp.]
MIEIYQWLAPDLEKHLDQMATLLHDCVHDGASIGFIKPHPLSEAQAFWQTSVLPTLSPQTRGLFVALKGDSPVGTVSVVLDTPTNQPHRAEIAKLMVHPKARRQGLARRLMQHAEDHARSNGRTLITLDTRTGDSAEPLYRSLGFETAGVIPEYCLDVEGQRLDSTTYMFKRLS